MRWAARILSLACAVPSAWAAPIAVQTGPAGFQVPTLVQQAFSVHENAPALENSPDFSLQTGQPGSLTTTLTVALPPSLVTMSEGDRLRLDAYLDISRREGLLGAAQTAPSHAAPPQPGTQADPAAPAGAPVTDARVQAAGAPERAAPAEFDHTHILNATLEVLSQSELGRIQGLSRSELAEMNDRIWARLLGWQVHSTSVEEITHPDGEVVTVHAMRLSVPALQPATVSPEDQRKARLDDLIDKLERRATIPRTGVVTDIHGDLRGFERWRKLSSEESVDGEVYLGDVFDKGPSSLAVADAIRQRVEARKAVALMGNHETLFLMAMLGDDLDVDRWLQNGGDSVLRELQAKSHSHVTHRNLRSNPRLQKLAAWLQQNLKLYHVDSHGVLYIHAGVPVGDDGLPALSYRGADGLAALDLMERDLRTAQSPNDPVFLALENPGSILRVTGWTEKLAAMAKSPEDLKRLLDRFLGRLGVLKIVHGHQVIFTLAQLDGRIFGTDVHDNAHQSRIGGTTLADSSGLRFLVQQRLHGDNRLPYVVHQLDRARYLAALKEERARLGP